MFDGPILIFRLFAPLLLFCQPFNSQELTAVRLDVKLPFPDNCQAPFYDGEDKIYLVGGCANNPNNKILVFSLSTETLTVVGSLPGRGSEGTVQKDGYGNIFFFGGSQVYKFDPKLNSTFLAATLPYDISSHTSFKLNDTSNTVYIMGGWFGPDDELLSFDMETLNSSQVTKLPLHLTSPTSVRVGNKAFIFDDANIENRHALELDLDTLRMRQVGSGTLPIFDWWSSSSVRVGNYLYIIGGFYRSRTDGVIQFNSETYENVFIPVGNLKLDNTTDFAWAPSSVFVPGKNRIYCFGGETYNWTAPDPHYTPQTDIFFIDLTPLQPDLDHTTD